MSSRLLPGLIETGLDPENLTRSHQAPAAMKALTVMIQPMVLSGPHTRRILSEKLPTLLMQSLPGIDPNDQRKTAVTMMLSYIVLSNIPVGVGSSSKSEPSYLFYMVSFLNSIHLTNGPLYSCVQKRQSQFSATEWTKSSPAWSLRAAKASPAWSLRATTRLI